jgi:DNA-binding MarR family transcriptional regulator
MTKSPKWLDPTEQRAWRGFIDTYTHLMAVLGKELAEETGLSTQDYAVLVALSEHPDHTMRSFELGDELAWEKSRLSHHLSRMVYRELVSRRDCPTDKRGAFIGITQKGRKAIKAAAPGHVSSVRRYFIDQLTKRELEALAKIGDKVQKALEEDPDHGPDGTKGGRHAGSDSWRRLDPSEGLQA